MAGQAGRARDGGTSMESHTVKGSRRCRTSTMSEDRARRVLGVEEQRHALGVLGVDSEVPGLLLSDPRRPERDGQPFEAGPGGTEGSAG